MAYSPNYSQSKLFYWDRDKQGSTAEVDYVINMSDTIVPIEVKLGKTGSLRSLQFFLDNKELPLGVRISAKPLSYNNRVLSVPFFMIHELKRLINSVLL